MPLPCWSAQRLTSKIRRSEAACCAGPAKPTGTTANRGWPKTLLEAGVADLESAGSAARGGGLAGAARALLLGDCSDPISRANSSSERATCSRRPAPARRLRSPTSGCRGSTFSTAPATVVSATRSAPPRSRPRQARGWRLAWSWNFLALAKIGSGLVDEGFRHLEDSYEASHKGGYDFQGGNAVYNASWMAVHLGQGRRARLWADRIDAAAPPGFSWPSYVNALYTLHTGRVSEAISLARKALQSARDLGPREDGVAQLGAARTHAGRKPEAGGGAGGAAADVEVESTARTPCTTGLRECARTSRPATSRRRWPTRNRCRPRRPTWARLPMRWPRGRSRIRPGCGRSSRRMPKHAGRRWCEPSRRRRARPPGSLRGPLRRRGSIADAV